MDIVVLIFLTAIGACIGSFLNVVIHRLPRGASIVFPPSHCPACGRSIRWYDNIPLVSWWVLGARCRWCKAPISPRYLVVEAATAAMFGGLYAWYYLWGLRRGLGPFAETWPTFLAHAALLSGLLACSVVDIEQWIVPLEVCWVVSGIGLVSAAAAPYRPLLPVISPTTGAMALAAAVGLAVAMFLRRRGWIRPSFQDAADSVEVHRDPAEAPESAKPRITAVAITKAHGVDPRREILYEVAYLAPAAVLAAGAWVLMKYCPPAARAWKAVASPYGSPFAMHANAFLSALLGMLVGGLWVWGARILGTLAFGKEAMGMGDVDLMASVGAVTGWIVPSLAFFVAPFFGLAWALVLLVRRKQRELPYGPWLAVGTLVVMLFYDYFAVLLRPYAQALWALGR
jgi:leader peptidase (prepilin peptidase)/N-methyltransferase